MLSRARPAEYRMILMAIADIIDAIDAYLLCLRNARELLLAPMTNARRKRASRSKRKVKVGKTAPTVSSRRNEKKNRPDRAVRERKIENERVDSLAQVRGAVARQPAVPVQPLIAATAATPQPTIEKEIVSPKRQMASVRSVRHRTARTRISTKPENIKPAIALAGSMNSKIVVVSAEQAQRERDRAAQSEVRRPRPPATGLSGKLAFEALFKDEPDPSKASDQ